MKHLTNYSGTPNNEDLGELHHLSFGSLEEFFILSTVEFASYGSVVWSDSFSEYL